MTGLHFQDFLSVCDRFQTSLLTMLSPTETEVSTTNSAPAEAASSRRPTLKKLLYHPLTWIAVGFHALLLVVPLSNQQPKDVPAEEEPAPEEEVAIDILNLSDISAPSPPPKNIPPPEAAPVPPSPAAPVSAPRQVAAVPAPAPATPAAGVPGATQPPGTQPPGTQPPGTQPPAFDPAPAQGAFISGLSSLGIADNTAVGMPDRKSFRRPQNFENFVSGTDPVAAAKDARWLDDEPADLFPVIQSTYAQSNITFTQLDNYGGELLYQLTADGQTILYMSIVALEGSSLLVMWENNPLD